MKKVLAIAPYKYLPFFSGGQKFIARVLENLANKTDLTVISVPENDFSLAKNYKTVPLLKTDFSRYYDSSLYKKILTIIRKEQIETILWEQPYYGWLARKLKKKTGVRTIIHTHNIEYQRFRSLGKWWWPILRSYEKRFFKMSDAIFFITPEDKNFAITKWKIPPGKCFELPFGVDIESYPVDRDSSRSEIISKYNIHPEAKILFFNGLLNYKPNLEGLNVILNEINPILLNSGYQYKIIVAGKNLPEEFHALQPWAGQNIIYTGFINDIGKYYKASDIFLNTVQSGGGVKTKLVEAIAYGTSAISTETGAIGLDRSICGQKLFLVKDNDWKSFTQAILSNSSINAITPAAYYEKYSWSHLVNRAIDDLT